MLNVNPPLVFQLLTKKRPRCNDEALCVPQSNLIHFKTKEQRASDLKTSGKYSNAKSYPSWWLSTSILLLKLSPENR